MAETLAFVSNNRRANQSLSIKCEPGMMNATARLSELLLLADRGPAMRAALAEEVAELLIHWPGDCPATMRSSCESLLARAAWEVDGATLARLRMRLSTHPGLAAFVLPPENGGHRLTDIARRGDNISPEMTRVFNLPRTRIKNILSDYSGRALAIACNGAGLSRATFSTLVILMSGKTRIAKVQARLDTYDAIDASEAAQLLRSWRDSDMAEQAA
jgi:Uncharacterised protein conserved in bacteria (DUF2336)